MSKIDDAKKQLGELFIMGFNGLELSDETSAFISQAQIGGVILFSHNYESPGQIAELTNQIQDCRHDLPLWISVDHEGGRVQRFKKPFTKIPEGQVIGANGSAKLAFDVSEMIAMELKAVGVNLNFSPVADIATNPKNPVIGARAFGAEEELVTKMVTAFVRGHLLQGVLPCVKHFPGHGDTSTDSHFALPKVDDSLEVLREREFKPFLKAFKSGCPMVMTAHILNPKLDAEKPATLSSKTLQDILRKELRFTKLIISDDMEMKAITDHFGKDLAPRMALQAGCDLLIYRSEAATRAAYVSLTRDLENGDLDPNLILESAARSRGVKTEFLDDYTPASVTDLGSKIGLPASAELIKKLTEVS
ncbi:MAG: beta-N-acetylhexosaminidase [Methylotenera sp.]|nr:beta-N-acetylhexosaminidase [Oligoflexia bacterium]